MTPSWKRSRSASKSMWPGALRRADCCRHAPSTRLSSRCARCCPNQTRFSTASASAAQRGASFRSQPATSLTRATKIRGSRRHTPLHFLPLRTQAQSERQSNTPAHVLFFPLLLGRKQVRRRQCRAPAVPELPEAFGLRRDEIKPPLDPPALLENEPVHALVRLRARHDESLANQARDAVAPRRRLRLRRRP